MEPTQELLDALFRERVLRARRMSPEEKIREGFRLFEREREIMRNEIRAKHPDADDARVQQLLGVMLDRKKDQELPTCDVPTYVDS